MKIPKGQPDAREPGLVEDFAGHRHRAMPYGFAHFSHSLPLAWIMPFAPLWVGHAIALVALSEFARVFGFLPIAAAAATAIEPELGSE